MTKNKNFFKGKKILIVGGTGTIGRRMAELLMEYSPAVVRIFSRDEFKQFEFQNEVPAEMMDKYRFLIGDVRDYDRVKRASQDIDIIFTLAAMKHVPACEYNPSEAVKTNVIGTENIIKAAISNNVEKVIFTSSDKAINPTNSMGATKLLAERLISAANFNKGDTRTVFSSVRFGNVMGSRGSVIPLFKKQIIQNNKIKITDGEMSRFMMSITEAAKLTLEAAVNSQGGEVFVLKMPVIKLQDLADVVVEEVCKKYSVPKENVEIETIGLRAGEKMFEELMTEQEAEYACEMEHMFVIPPVFGQKEKCHEAIGVYSSQNSEIITKEEIRDILQKENII